MSLMLACFFLAGSILLPLGDFSLMNDLPGMYRAYEKLATPEEIGVIDFVGDYLLGGKALLNHNHRDKPETRGIAVQFQHSATSYSFLKSQIHLSYIVIEDIAITHTLITILVKTSDFHPELFRPPLT